MPTDPEDDQQLLDINQAASLLNVSAVSLRRWTESGRLPCLRVGGRRARRFRRDDLLAFLEREGAAGGTDSAAPAAVAQLDIEGVTVDYGSHLCALYETDGGRAKLAVPFLDDGLAAEDRCFLVAPGPAQAQLLADLRRLRPGLDDDLEGGRLVVTDGATGGDAIYDYFEQAFQSAIRAGVKRLRVLGDMTWFIDRGLSIDELNEFEMRYDRMLGHSYPVVSFCLYDARRFDGIGILRALKCHEDTFRLPLSRFLVR